jgi:hypothetical protein
MPPEAMGTRAFRLLFLTIATGVGAAHAADAFGDATYYYGDLHAHTGYSGDGGAGDLGNCEGSCGDVATMFDTARANGLDFVAFSDHVNGSAAARPPDFAALTAAVLAADDPEGGFVTIPAAELWFTVRGTDQKLGHKTLLLFGGDAALAGIGERNMSPGASSGVDSCDDIWTWMTGVSAALGPAILVPHHPAVLRPMPTDWSCHDPAWEPTVEIYSEHGNSLEDTSGYDPPGEGVVHDSTVHAALDPDGYALMFGFVGGTDSHDTRPGGVCDIDTEQPTHLYGGGLTVAVLQPDEPFDRTSIHAAILARRTYVTTGPELPVEVAWSAGGVPLGGLGAALAVPASKDLDATVRIPVERSGPVTGVSLVGPDATWPLEDDGAGTWSGHVSAGETPAWLYVAVAIDGAAWYGATPCADGGDDAEWIWTSPSPLATWVDDLDGDGASSVDADCDDADPAIHPGATELWYDGVDQDCDGASDYDADHDGADAQAYGGSDCDDTDPAVIACPDTATPVDSADTAGGAVGADTSDTSSDVSEPCGCHAGGGTAGAWIAALGFLTLRRRT